MRITWRDGITTLAVAATIVVERAYFHAWDWPLISSMNWTIGIIALLTAVGLLFSYVLDKYRGTGWSIVAGLFGLSTAVLAGLGLYFTNSDFVVMLMLNAVLFWVASLVRHITVHEPMTHYHA